MKIGASGRARTQRIVSGLYWRLHLTVSLRALVACSVLQFLARRKRRMVASDKNDGISAVIWLPRSSRTFFICRFEIERLYIIFEKLWLTVLVSSPLFAVDIYIYRIPDVSGSCTGHLIIFTQSNCIFVTCWILYGADVSLNSKIMVWRMEIYIRTDPDYIWSVLVSNVSQK